MIRSFGNYCLSNYEAPVLQRFFSCAPKKKPFPNVFLDETRISRKLAEQNLPFKKAAVEKTFAHLLQKIDILHLDPKSKSQTRTGFFEQIETIVKIQDPNANVYLSGGSIRSIFGFLYEEIFHAQKYGQMSSEEALGKMASNEFRFRNEYGGRLCKLDVLGIGSDLDILIEFSPSFEDKQKTISSVSSFINTLGQAATDSLLSRTYFTVADVHEYEEQTSRATLQGGISSDWLGFPITARSGSKFKTPPQYPSIVDDLLKGEVEFYPTSNAECKEVTTARAFRTFCELPHLTLTPTSQTRFNKSIDQLKDIDHNLERKVAFVFQRCMQNLRLPEASNRYVVTPSIFSYEAKYGNLVKKWVPEFLPSKEIEYREKGYDAGDFKKEGWLIPYSDFVAKHTDRGVLYHGTPNRENGLPMLRGILAVSTDQENRPQGTALFGRGFYTTPDYNLAKKYGNCVLPFQITKSDKLRVLDLSLFKTHKRYEEIVLEANRANKDLHELLCDAYDIDIIIKDDLYPLIQNAKAFSVGRRIDSAPFFFFKEAILTNNTALVISHLKEKELSTQERGEFALLAVREQVPSILKLLLENGSLSEKDRGEAVLAAVKAGSKEMFCDLLQHGFISENIQEQSLFAAAGINEKAIVEKLLQNGSISKKGRQRALLNAVSYGHQEIVQVLLENGPISEETRNEAIIQAASHRSVELIEKLLENGPISEKARGDAMTAALLHNHIGVVQKLLESGSISEKARSHAIIQAVNQSLEEILEILLEGGSISEKEQEDALIAASYYGNVRIVAKLLQKAAIGEETRNRAIINAAKHPKEELIEILLQKGPISQKARSRAIVETIRRGFKTSFDLLFEPHILSEDLRGEGVIEAIRQGSEEILEKLFKDGPISEIAREEALIAASIKSNERALEKMLEKPIAQNFLNDAIREASKHGSQRIVQKLLQNGPISEEARKEAIENAKTLGHEEIIQLLLPKHPLFPIREEIERFSKRIERRFAAFQ